MLKISDRKIELIKEQKYRVYSKEPLKNGTECFNSKKEIKDSKVFVTSVKASNIRCDNNRFYYTTEDLAETIDWFPSQVISIGNTFKKCKKVGKNIGKKIGSNCCLIDVEGLPAFSGITTTEDVSIHEYRLYTTLFNDYSVRECLYDRRSLFDAKFNCSKYDLVFRIQNSDFLKSKDFKVINVKREKDEIIKIGIIVKEPEIGDHQIDYGTITIDMLNQISINWH